MNGTGARQNAQKCLITKGTEKSKRKSATPFRNRFLSGFILVHSRIGELTLIELS
jgi:hypothetical protein